MNGITLNKIRITKGPNVFALFPVAFAEVSLNELENVSSADVPGFAQKLLNLLPGLREHACSPGYPGGFIERLEKGTYAPHIAEHIALELQNYVGVDVRFGKSIRLYGDRYMIAVEYKYPGLARLALKEAVHLVDKILRGEEFSDMEVVLHSLRKQYESERLGPTTSSMVSAAKRHGIPVLRLDEELSLFQLGWGAKSRRIWASVSSETSLLSSEIGRDKILSKRLLASAGLPVPSGEEVKNAEEALRAARNLGYPVVVKPVDSHHGKGVIGNIRSDEELFEAYNIAKTHSERVLVEEYCDGDDYRFLVIGGRLAAAARRVSPSITGDGKKTIKELVDELNNDPLRGIGHENYLTQVKLGEEEIQYLKSQGLTPGHTPDKGEIIYLRRNANLSTGGTAEDVTDILPEETIQTVERATRIVGLDVAGVDAIIKDIKRPLEKGNGVIIEINAAPGLRMHLLPAEGKRRNVGNTIIEHLFGGDNGRIPLVSVTGTNGKTTTCRLISHILSEAGYSVGLAVTGGIYIDGKEILKGDTTGPWSANLVLGDPSVEAAVLETARGGIIRRGLGYDRAYIGAVLNISEDHEGVDGIRDAEDVLWIKSVVIEAVSKNGYSVINGTDRYAKKLIEKAGGKIAIFSMEDTEILEEAFHKGWPACYLRNEEIFFFDGEEHEKIISSREMGFAREGLVKCMVENGLAAILIAKLMRIPSKVIREALKSRRNIVEEFPGRFNIVEYRGRDIVLDYAHNPPAIRAFADFLRSVPHNHSICVFAMPGDRSDDLIMENGKALGEVFDEIILTAKESELRGRPKKELLRFLKNGVESAGKNPRIIEEPLEAVRKAIDRSIERGVLCVLLGFESPEEFFDFIGASEEGEKEDVLETRAGL